MNKKLSITLVVILSIVTFTFAISKTRVLEGDFTHTSKADNFFSKLLNLQIFGATYPTTYDLRDSNAVPSPDDRKTLSNMSWAFAVNDAIESHLLKKNKGTYNLSENQLDYLSRYYGYTSSFGEATYINKPSLNEANVTKYFITNSSPVTETKFGSYFTTQQTKSLSSYIDYENVEIDVKNAYVNWNRNIDSVYKSNGMTLAFVNSTIEEHLEEIKNHLMNYGAVATGVYWDYYDSSKNLLRNDGTKTISNDLASIKNVVIIGWDDNYGTVNVLGEEAKGAWLAMNSEGTNNQYFYISYYDMTHLDNLFFVTDADIKTWNNSYTNYEVISSSGNTKKISYLKGSQSETLDSVKIRYNNGGNITVKVCANTTCDSNSVSVERVMNGIVTIPLNNITLDTQNVTVEITSAELINKISEIILQTRDTDTTPSIEIIEDASNQYSLTSGELLRFKLISKSVPSTENYTFKVYDALNNDITSNFTIQSDTNLINNYGVFDISCNKKTETAQLKIEVTASGYKGAIVKTFGELPPNGSEERPYEIKTISDIKTMEGSSSYYKLMNNIDLNSETNWTPINFNGVLLGNNFKISNLKSTNGGLFELLNGTVKDLEFENAVINVDSSIGYVGVLANSTNKATIDNISIENSYISNVPQTTNDPRYAGGLVGLLLGGNTSNIYINADVEGQYAGGLAGNITFSQKSGNNYIEQTSNISNVVISTSRIYSTTNKGKAGYLAGYLFGYHVGNVTANTLFVNTHNMPDVYENASSFINNVAQIYQNGTFCTNLTDCSSIFNGTNLNELTNEQKLIESSYGSYNNSKWNFDSSVGLYLKSFGIPTLLEEIEEEEPTDPPIDPNPPTEPGETLTVTFNGYDVDESIVFNISPKTSNAIFKSKIETSDDENVTITLYENDGTEMSLASYVRTGDYVIITNDTTSIRYDISVKGDVNKDGKIGIGDLNNVADYISANTEAEKNIIIPNDYQLKSADFTGDGKIRIGDLNAIADSI